MLEGYCSGRALKEGVAFGSARRIRDQEVLLTTTAVTAWARYHVRVMDS